MSDTRVSLIPAAATTDPRLTNLDVRILTIIGSAQANQGFVRIKRSQIAVWAQCAESSVPRSIRKLEQFGYAERRAAHDGRVQSANEYRVKLDQPAPFAAAQRPPATGIQHDTRGREDTRIPQDTRIHHETPKPLGVSDENRTNSGGRGITQDTRIPSDTGYPSPHTPLSELPLISESNPDRVVISPPIVPPTPPATRAGQGREVTLSDDFVEAWKLWPKHVRASNKKLCAQLWAKRAGDARLVAAVRRYLASPDATKADNEGRTQAYVPALEVWLRNKADFWLEQIENGETSNVHVLDASDRRAAASNSHGAPLLETAGQGRRPRTNADVLAALAARARDAGL